MSRATYYNLKKNTKKTRDPQTASGRYTPRCLTPTSPLTVCRSLIRSTSQLQKLNFRVHEIRDQRTQTPS